MVLTQRASNRLSEPLDFGLGDGRVQRERADRVGPADDPPVELLDALVLEPELGRLLALNADVALLERDRDALAEGHVLRPGARSR